MPHPENVTNQFSRGTCRSEACGAVIIWARSRDGKAIPLDVEPTADGNLALVGGIAEAYGLEHAAEKLPRYTSHFATCPDAPAFRKEKPGRKK